MNRVALVVIARSQEKPIDNPLEFVAVNVDTATLGDADYHIIWEPGRGFNVVQHPLDVEGSKKGFISAPDVTIENLDDRVRFALNESDDLVVWKIRA